MTLDTKTDELTLLLADAEEALRELRYGVTAKVTLGIDHFLSYEKSGADWVLMCHLPNGQKTPLLSAQRKLRVFAADSMMALHDELLSERDRIDRDVQQAVEKMKLVNANLREVMKKKPRRR